MNKQNFLPILFLSQFFSSAQAQVESINNTIDDSTSKTNVELELNIVGSYTVDRFPSKGPHRHVHTYISLSANGTYQSNVILNDAFGSGIILGNWVRKGNRLHLTPSNVDFRESVFKIQLKNDTIHLNTLKSHMCLLCLGKNVNFKGPKVEMIPKPTPVRVKLHSVDSNAVYEVVHKRVMQIVQDKYQRYELDNCYYYFQGMGRALQNPHSVEKPMDGYLWYSRVGQEGLSFGLKVDFEDSITNKDRYTWEIKEIYARYSNSKPWQLLSEYIEDPIIACDASMQEFIRNNKDKYPGGFAAFETRPDRFLYVEVLPDTKKVNEWEEFNPNVKVAIFTSDGEQLTPLHKFQGDKWWSTFSIDGIYYCAAGTEFTVVNEKNESAVFNISGEMIHDFGDVPVLQKED